MRLTAAEWATAHDVCTPKQLHALDCWRKELGYKRMSIVLGISPSAAKAHVFAALAKVKPELIEERVTEQDRMWREQSAIFAREHERARREGLVNLPECYLCGEPTHPEDMHTDHIIPRAAGGTDDLHNLAGACGRCNSKKRDLIVAFSVATRKPTFMHRVRA